jgi:uncharacterized membrane protein
MNAILLANFGYMLIAIESVVSKFLLSGKVKSWKLFVFYIGLFSGFSIFFAPFGLHWYGFEIFLISLLAGILFFVHYAVLYRTLEHCQASRVYVVSGAVATMATILLTKTFQVEEISSLQFLGVCLLLVGGILVSLKVKELEFFEGFTGSVLAGLVLSLSLVVLKYTYVEQDFISGYVYTRMGSVVATILFLSVPSVRKEVMFLLKKKGNKERAGQFFSVMAAKVIAAAGTLMVNGAIYMGNVSVVNALIAVQYLCTFIFSLLLSLRYAKIYAEKFMPADLILKSIGVGLVVAGVFFVY